MSKPAPRMPASQPPLTRAQMDQARQQFVAAFAPSRERRRVLEAQAAASQQASAVPAPSTTPPIDRDKLRQLLPLYRAQVAKIGFNPDDLGDAATFAILISHEAVTGRSATSLARQMVRAKMHVSFAGDTNLQNSTAQRKRQRYEQLAARAMAIQLLHQDATKTQSADTLNRVRASARALFRELTSAEPEAMRITDQGLVTLVGAQTR